MAREALKLALEALKIWEQMYPKSSASCYRTPAITAIKEALAHPAQEPVAWIWKDMRGQDIVSLFEPRLNSIPLYAAPPQRPWVGLTDEEIKDIIGSWGDTPIKGYTRKLFDQIEAKLKEKNT